MPKQETSEAGSIDNASSLPKLNDVIKNLGRMKFKTMSKDHVLQALTIYLRSMSMINDNEEVTNFNKSPDSLDVKVEKIV